MDDIQSFLSEHSQPYYLAHAVRAIADYINSALCKKHYANDSELYLKAGLVRLFDILLIKKADVPEGAKCIFYNPQRTSDRQPVLNMLAIIQYDSSLVENPRLLRMLIAHELAHIYLRHVLKKYSCDRKELKRDSQEEYDAWELAIEIIHHKDQHYLSAKDSFCHCCKNAIIETTLLALGEDSAHYQKIQALKTPKICPECRC